ncbi:MAG: hypothetical protein AAFY66_05675 [Pseudomonadota bacterium]
MKRLGRALLGVLVGRIGSAVACSVIWAATSAAASANGCTAPPGALFHACAGEGSASVLVLPGDWPPTDAAVADLLVTGAYTGKDARADGTPAPVGLLIREGRLIGRNIARMDGILVIDAASGRPGLYRRDRVALGGEPYDLSPLDQREAFFEAASTAGASVLQSHLLVIDGKVDTKAVDGAPAAQRRILYTMADGAFGIWQSEGALTLDEAARTVAEEVAPTMALNLDMGSFDFCLARRPGYEPEPCGVIGASQMPGRLSNLLRLTR